MKNVPGPKVVTVAEAAESPLPAQIQEALGELVGAAREGLLALSVGVGLGVVHELIELEVDGARAPSTDEWAANVVGIGPHKRTLTARPRRPSTCGASAGETTLTALAGGTRNWRPASRQSDRDARDSSGHHGGGP